WQTRIACRRKECVQPAYNRDALEGISSEHGCARFVFRYGLAIGIQAIERVLVNGLGVLLNDRVRRGSCAQPFVGLTVGIGPLSKVLVRREPRDGGYSSRIGQQRKESQNGQIVRDTGYSQYQQRR